VGAAVRFTPPMASWTVWAIQVNGFYSEGDGVFDLEVWDSERNELFHGTYDYSQFFQMGTPGWATIPIEPVSVSGDFYVAVFPHWVPDEHRLWLSFDVTEPAALRSYDVEMATNVILQGPHPDWDWLIRAIGPAP
jgi:hypothetical protein